MNKEKLVIIENYNKFYNYVYNPIINTNRKHKILRDEFLNAIISQYKLLFYAVRSNQKSRIYEADIGIAYIKTLMRNLIHKTKDRRTFSMKQISIAEVLLANVGKMLNSMLKNK